MIIVSLYRDIQSPSFKRFVVFLLNPETLYCHM